MMSIGPPGWVLRMDEREGAFNAARGRKGKDRNSFTSVGKERQTTDLVDIIKYFQNGEDASTNEKSHLTSNVTWERNKQNLNILFQVL